MFAITWPGTGSEQDIRHLPQARAAVACIYSVQRDQPVGEPPVRPPRQSDGAKHADGGDPIIDAVVVGDVKAKCDRPGNDATLAYVHPHGSSAMVYLEVFATHPPHDADFG